MSTVDIKLPGLATFKLALHRGPDLYISPDLWKHGIWEPCVTSYMLGTIRAGQNVVDVGAHIGYFTIIMSLLVGDGGRVFAFEPEPRNVDLLRTNLALNGVRNVTVESRAVSDRVGRAGLHVSGSNTGDHRLYGSAAVEQDVHEVDTVTLDGYFDHACDPVHFVKIDAQGLEARILDGMGRLIARNRGQLTLLMEFSPGLLRCAGCDVGDFLRRLESLRAAVFWLHKGHTGSRTTTRATARDLRGIADLMLRMRDDDYSADIVLCFDR